MVAEIMPGAINLACAAAPALLSDPPLPPEVLFWP